MAVELDGTVRMRGDSGPGVGVRVLAQNRRLRLVSGNELVGEWQVDEIGIQALHDGFNIKAEGEEFVLTTSDDVALAEEIGLTAASPRLARRMATRHNPDEPDQPQEPATISSRLGAVGFALAGALVILGGIFLDQRDQPVARSAEGDGFEFWIAFVIGGVLMVATAYVMSIGARVARVLATVLLVGVIVVFGFAVSEASGEVGELTAYGFIAGGMVVGVAVLFSGSLRET